MTVSQPTSSPARKRPDDRYGRRPGHPWARRLAIIGIAAFLAGALAWWIWVAALRSSPAVRFELLGFDPLSGSAVDIRWRVDREPGVSVECVLRARNATGEEVGRDRVTVPIGETASLELRHTLTTSGQAVTGEVLLCFERTD